MKRIVNLLLALLLLTVPAFSAGRPMQNFGVSHPVYNAACFEAEFSGFQYAWDAILSSHTLSGNDITQVTAYCGGGDPLVADSGKRPDYSATALNGKPGWVFNGTTDIMYDLNSFPTTGNFSVAVVHMPGTPFNDTIRALIGQSGSGLSITTGIGNDEDKAKLKIGDSAHSVLAYATALAYPHHLQPEVVVATVNTSTRVGKIYINGILVGTGTADAAITRVNDLYVGGWNNDSFPWKGTVSSVSQYNAELNLTEVQQLSRGLMTRYNIKPRYTIFVAGHSNNNGYGVEDTSTNNLKSWPYLLGTVLAGEGKQFQIINISVPGDEVEDQDGDADASIDLMTVPYRSRTILSVYSMGNNINNGDSNATALTKLRAFIQGRQSAQKFDVISVSTEAPGFNSGATTNLLSWNSHLASNQATLISDGANYFPVLANIPSGHFASWAAWNNSASVISDDTHLTETGAQAVADLFKSVWGL